MLWKNTQNWKNSLIIDLVFHQIFAFFAMCSQFISADSPSWAEQNGTKDFVITSVVVETFLSAFRPLKAEFLWPLWTYNSTIEHDTTELITPFHSESYAHSNDINISYYDKYPKFVKIPLLYRLGVSSKVWHFCNVLKTLNNSYQ